MMLAPSNPALSRLSTAALAVTLLLGTPLLTSCDKLIPKVPLENTSKLPPDVLFRDARALIIDGKPAEAAKALRKLDERDDIAQPTHNWVTLYAGLAELLAGHDEESRKVFAKLVERGPFSTEGGSRKLADFFTEIGQRMSSEGRISSKISSRYERTNYQALALFLYGLKNESVEEFDDAGAFYRQFTTIAPRDPEPWTGFDLQLKSLAYSASRILEYEDLIESAQHALQSETAKSSAEEHEKAVADAKALRKKIKFAGKLTASLDHRMNNLSEKSEKQSEMTAAGAEADAKALPEAKQKWSALAEAFHFQDARSAILEPKLVSAEAKKEQDAIAATTDYLENFKFYLVQEIAASGYTQPLQLKDGASITGITKVDDLGAYLKDASGTEKIVPWAQIATESIYTMAKSLITEDEAPDAQGFRKWHLGHFAAYIGKPAEARALLQEAAKLNPAYQEELPMFLESLPGA